MRAALPGLMSGLAFLACTASPESVSQPQAPPPVASEPAPVTEKSQAVSAPRKPNEQVAMSVTWAQIEGSGPPQLVAQLEAIPEWHIYWAHPGDAGLPTRFRLQRGAAELPHDTRMPLPKRMTSAGDIVSYGYEGKTHFFIDSEQARSGGEFSLRADWLACKEICIKGKATVTVPPPPKRGSQPTDTMTSDWQEVPKGKAIKWQREGPAWVLEVATAKRVELYPHGALQLALDQTRPPYCKGKRCRIKLPPSALQENPTLAYTLRIENTDTTHGLEADFLKGIQP